MHKFSPKTLMLWLCYGLGLSLSCKAADKPPEQTPGPPFVKDPAERSRIEQAIPRKALITPLKPRRLLIFDLNVGYGGHGSIPYANQAFSRMGEATGAYETVVSHDPSVFKPESLRRFDAVFFNNNVGNLFTEPELRQSLLEFVYGGGGLMGVHGTTVAFTKWPGAIEDWPEFGNMLGARGANHRDSDELVITKLDDPGHPINQVFGGQGFEYRDEFFRVHDPYSRNRVRVLFSIDTEKSDQKGAPRGDVLRSDNDYALAWVRSYGRGRVFYCTIAHNPYVFWDSKMLQFYFAATQFALGDLPAPTTPSAKLTPAIRAQEKLGWRLGVECSCLQQKTVFEAVDKTVALGLLYLSGTRSQQVSKDLPRNFDEQLPDNDLQQVRSKLDAAGIRMLTYDAGEIPGDEPGCRKLFEFGRKMGIETFIVGPLPAGTRPNKLDTIEKFCDQYDIKLAIQNGPAKSSQLGRPKDMLNLCQNRSKRIGVCARQIFWLEDKIDCIEAVKMLKERLFVLQVDDLKSADLKRLPWGTGSGETRKFLGEIHRMGIIPGAFNVNYPTDSSNAMSDIIQCVEFFNKTSLQLAQ